MRETPLIRILIADDHVLVRSGLTLLINQQADMSVIGEASDGESAIQLTDQLNPSLILLDLTMPPGKGGIHATAEIKKKHPQIPILILTMHDDPELIFSALQAGASGYVLKQGLDVDLIDAIHQVVDGGLYLYPSATKPMVEEFLRNVAEGNAGETRAFLDLTEREREVLSLVAAGYTNKEIAAQLHISVKTVENHKAHIMEKLNLYTRADLVRYAIRRGYLTLNQA